mgnify:CR=1 FL=1
MDFYFSSNRIFIGIAAGCFGLLVVMLGGWWFSIAVGLIVHLALLEYFRMAKFTGIRPAIKTTLVSCQLLLLTTQLSMGGALPEQIAAAVLPLSGAAICGWLLLQPETGSISDISASIFGLFYLGFLPSHWIRLRNFSDIDIVSGLHSMLGGLFNNISSGMAITLVACLMIVASDIGSYVLGRRFGQHNLSPISPQKTIEGAVGGFLCAILIGSFAGLLFEWNFGLIIGGLLGALVALFALVGDLTESMMKRNAGLKDSGDALPGHGGILDRIDSYLFTPAVVYYAVVLLIPIFN